MSGLTALVRHRPVAAVIVTALVTAAVTTVVLLGVGRSPVVAPPGPVPGVEVPAQNRVAVFLTDQVTEDQRRAIESALRALPSVTGIHYESRQEAYAKFTEQFKDAPDLTAGVKPESLPASFQVTITAPADVCALARRLDHQPGVADVVGPGPVRPSC